MTRAEIQAFFPRSLVQFGGANYAVPTVAWLTGPFWQYFKAKLWSDDVDTWSVKWECRDFARAYACFAQLANARSSGTPDGDDALAVGEFWFHPDTNPPGEDHAICACITDQGLTFIEPQTGAVRPMSATEIASCTFARF